MSELSPTPPVPPALVGIEPSPTIDDGRQQANRPQSNRPQSNTARRAGITTVAEGVVIAVVGIVGLWLSFWLGDSAKTILGAGPLFGGGMIGFGTTQLLFGSSLRFLRWVVAVISGIALVGVTIVLLETTLGVTFA